MAVTPLLGSRTFAASSQDLPYLAAAPLLRPLPRTFPPGRLAVAVAARPPRHRHGVPGPKMNTTVHLSLYHFGVRDHQVPRRSSPCTTTTSREPLPSTQGRQVPLRPVYDYVISPSTPRMRQVRLHGPPSSSTDDSNDYETPNVYHYRRPSKIPWTSSSLLTPNTYGV